METGSVSTAIDNLDQQPFRLPVKTHRGTSGGTSGGGEEEEDEVDHQELTQYSLEFLSENMAAP